MFFSSFSLFSPEIIVILFIRRFVFPAANSLFGCVDDGVTVGGGGTRQQQQQQTAAPANSSLFPYEIKSTCGGARLNAVSCPSNPDLVAYVCGGDVWVTHVVTGQEERVTFSSRDAIFSVVLIFHSFD